jgi:hypothetical protein
LTEAIPTTINDVVRLAPETEVDRATSTTTTRGARPAASRARDY